jgi:hypothetical protein
MTLPFLSIPCVLYAPPTSSPELTPKRKVLGKPTVAKALTKLPERHKRKITKEEWGSSYNDELHTLYSSPSIIVCSFIWVRNLVSDIKGRTQTGGT